MNEKNDTPESKGEMIPPAIISMIAAMDEDKVISKDSGGMPWKRIPKDFNQFKEKTMGHPIIMGRTTWEEFGGRPLPGRISIVMTSRENYKVPEGVIVVNNAEQALNAALYEEADKKPEDREIFIIGGAQIYEIFLECSDRLYLTVIEKRFGGSVKFPEYTDLFHKLIKADKDSDENYHFTFLIIEK
jgi:dihydrofolate reductase